MMIRILLVEDDEQIASLLSQLLEAEGFFLQVEYDGEAGEAAMQQESFDIVILDIMLPGKNGLDILRDQRETTQAGIIMLTARGEDVDRIVGLEVGADDYLPKPFNPRELTARIRALLRRMHRSQQSKQAGTLKDGPLEVDTKAMRASIAGKPLALTVTEYNILSEFLSRRGEVISRAELTELALGRKLSAYDRAIDMHVSNLRKKLSTAKIETIRGAGYLYPSVQGLSENVDQ